MAIRLNAMKRALKKTGSIYLHCDPTASHYLKMIMDAIFSEKNFRNEIIWHYLGSSITAAERIFPRKHDVIFFYSASPKYTFNQIRESKLSIHMEKRWGKYLEPDGKTVLYESIKHESKEESRSRKRITKKFGRSPIDSDIAFEAKPSLIRSVWTDIPEVRNNTKYKESLGYPTQKPIDLLKRIILASSNKGDLVFDPFCGCGTTLHAAEELKRKWIGIDISQFSAGLVRNRLLNNFTYLDRKNIPVLGCPLTIADAEDLAGSDRFEFEKWACGEVGAQGLYHEPGERGSDGGVDGVIPFYYSKEGLGGGSPEKTFAVVQVKSGKVNPDNVKALSTTVRQSGAKCGVFICFEKYMNTVENNREKKKLKDWTGEFNFIQGLSVERIINGEMPNIPGLRKAA
ncbi:MAG: DNA methyltransferase [Rhodobacteraceae bacterium]|nr:DNA methyltransferase [Paracoccaceae bacterium]